jgi:hypothetical protein
MWKAGWVPSEEPIDLIRIEGGGNSVVLRITGKKRLANIRLDGPSPGRVRTEALVGEFLVDTPFVRGSRSTSVLPHDLRDWRDALDAFDLQGRDIAWREDSSTELFIERIEEDLDEDQDERVHVTLRDSSMSLTTVTVTIPLADSWFDDAYDRLDRVWKTWDPAEGGAR